MRSQTLARGLALLAPPRCSGCDQACPPGIWICANCRAQLQRLRRPPTASSVSAAHQYSGVARRLVAALKFEGAVALADELADSMLAAMPGCVGARDLIVPVPAHPANRRRRGYNQARLLADALAARSGARVLDCLTRDGSRPPQSELSRAGRLAMPASAIGIARRRLERLDGTYVVLCDDVTTTGVTLELCAQAIRDQFPGGGSASIRGVVFALASGRGWAKRPGTTDRAAGAVAPKADSLTASPPAVRSTSVNSSK